MNAFRCIECCTRECSLDEFLKCFIVQGQRQVRHRPCVIKKPAGDFAGKKGGPLEKNTDI